MAEARRKVEVGRPMGEEEETWRELQLTTGISIASELFEHPDKYNSVEELKEAMKATALAAEEALKFIKKVQGVPWTTREMSRKKKELEGLVVEVVAFLEAGIGKAHLLRHNPENPDFTSTYMAILLKKIQRLVPSPRREEQDLDTAATIDFVTECLDNIALAGMAWDWGTSSTTSTAVALRTTSSAATIRSTSMADTGAATNKNITTTGAANKNIATTGAATKNITATSMANTGAATKNITTTGAATKNISNAKKPAIKKKALKTASTTNTGVTKNIAKKLPPAGATKNIHIAKKPVVTKKAWTSGKDAIAHGDGAASGSSSIKVASGSSSTEVSSTTTWRAITKKTNLIAITKLDSGKKADAAKAPMAVADAGENGGAGEKAKDNTGAIMKDGARIGITVDGSGDNTNKKSVDYGKKGGNTGAPMAGANAGEKTKEAKDDSTKAITKRKKVNFITKIKMEDADDSESSDKDSKMSGPDGTTAGEQEEEEKNMTQFGKELFKKVRAMNGRGGNTRK